MFYRFNSYIKTIPMLHQYINYSGVKIESNRLNIDALIDFFNHGFPLPQLNIGLDKKEIYGKNSQELVFFVNELMSESSDLFVDLYAGELLKSSSVGIDELYVVPVHYMFDNIKLIKYERTLDDSNKVRDKIDKLYAKFNQKFTIVVNELYVAKKGTF